MSAETGRIMMASNMSESDEQSENDVDDDEEIIVVCLYCSFPMPYIAN
jgi:hypothetical protein